VRLTALACLVVALSQSQPSRAATPVAVHGGIAERIHTLAVDSDGSVVAEVDLELVLDRARNEARAYFTHVTRVDSEDGSQLRARNLVVQRDTLAGRAGDYMALLLPLPDTAPGAPYTGRYMPERRCAGYLYQWLLGLGVMLTLDGVETEVSLSELGEDSAGHRCLRADLDLAGHSTVRITRTLLSTSDAPSDEGETRSILFVFGEEATGLGQQWSMPADMRLDLFADYIARARQTDGYPLPEEPTVADDESPTAKQALGFLRTLPPVMRDGEPVHRWRDATVEDIRSMTTLELGGHVEGGGHLHIDGHDWRYLTAFESVEVANLWEIGGADDCAFYHLSKMAPSLHTLNVEQADTVTLVGVRQLRRLKGLKTLMIGWSANIDDDAVAEITTLRGLEELNLSGCPKITGSTLTRLNRGMMPNLRSLKLSMSALTDDTLMNLTAIGVEELDLSRAPAWVEGAEYHISFEGIRSFLSAWGLLADLRVLTLKNVDLTEEQWADLAELRPNLEIVH